MKNYITELDVGTLSLNRALVKFYICDFYLAKEYALNALVLFDKTNNSNNKINIKNTEEDDKYIQVEHAWSIINISSYLLIITNIVNI